MRKVELLIVLFIILLTRSAAQVNGLSLAARFGAAAGYTPLWVYADTKIFNEKLAGWGLDKLSEKGIFVSSGSGYVYLSFLKNVRIGGMGFSGACNESSDQAGINKEIDYSLSGGGVTIEYTLPFIKKIGISIGAIIGSGKTEINIYQNSSDFNWDNFTSDLIGSDFENKNFYVSLRNNYYLFIPTINFDIPINRFMAFRAGGGYQITFCEEWKVNNDRNISALPDELNSKAFYFQAGLLIGFFAF